MTKPFEACPISNIRFIYIFSALLVVRFNEEEGF